MPQGLIHPCYRGGLSRKEGWRLKVFPENQVITPLLQKNPQKAKHCSCERRAGSRRAAHATTTVRHERTPPGAAPTGPPRAWSSSEGYLRPDRENKRKLKGNRRQQKGADTLRERPQISGIFTKSRKAGWESCCRVGARAQRRAATTDTREVCTGSSRCHNGTVTQFPISERRVRRENAQFPLKEGERELANQMKMATPRCHPGQQGPGRQEDRKPTEDRGPMPHNAQDTKILGKGREILMFFPSAKVTNPGRKNTHKPSICIL